jgi:hypothetical protein
LDLEEAGDERRGAAEVLAGLDATTPVATLDEAVVDVTTCAEL